MNNKISICFICDENYVKPTLVAINSIKLNKNEKSVYEIYVLGENLREENKNILKKQADKRFFIRILDISNNTFNNLKEQNIHVSKAALSKFFIPNIFKDLDKILYLDSDIIVKKDLSNIFSIDITKYYAAVVKDYKAMDYNPPQTVKLGLKHKAYFNSGLMLLNLSKMRKENITEKLVAYRKNGINYFMDQDAFNAVFNENVLYISFLNNVILSVLGYFEIEKINKYYELKEYSSYKDIYNEATIIHLASPYKPWIYDNVPFSDEWNRIYANLGEEKLQLKHLDVLNKEKSFAMLDIYRNREDMGIDMPVIISLTTYPKRIKSVHKVINTLLKQNILVDKIILWLAKEQFPNGIKDLPEELMKMASKGLEINWCDDIGAHKKYYYTMQKYPDSIVITVDDDIYYPNNLVEKLLISYMKFPNAISARRVHLIEFNNGILSPYKEWKQCYTKIDFPAMALMATGVGGILYPPGLLDKEVFNKESIKNLALKGDDLWLKVIEVISNVPVVVADKKCELEFVEGTQEEALWHRNVIENGNDKQFNEILSNYNDFKRNKYSVEEKIKKSYDYVKLIDFINKKERRKAINKKEICHNNYTFTTLFKKVYRYYKKHGIKMTIYKIKEKLKEKV